MSLSAPAVHRGIAVGAFSATLLFGSAAIAVADPPANCTAADLARTASGVSNATADYLFNHPDVNDFFTGLRGQDRDAMSANTQNYLDANPSVKTDLQGIRQPLVDFKGRCQ